MTQKPEHIVIVGGGVIGLSVGWQLLRKGIAVSLLERGEVGRRASYAAAGMLAPYAEVGFEEVELMKLGQRSLQLYPQFLDQLAEDADEVPTLDRCGTLMAGIDRDDTEHLRRLYDFREELALPVELMTGTAAREREPHAHWRRAQCVQGHLQDHPQREEQEEEVRHARHHGRGRDARWPRATRR